MPGGARDRGEAHSGRISPASMSQRSGPTRCLCSDLLFLEAILILPAVRDPANEMLPMRLRSLRPMAVGVFFSVGVGACASGGGASPTPSPVPTATPAATPTPAPPPSAPAPLPEDRGADLAAVRGFDGGTALVGFSGRASSIQDTIVRESPNRVWGVLPAVFSTLGVQTRTVEPAAYTIGLEAGRISRIEGGRLSQHLECGNGILGPNADHYDVTLTLLVQLAGHASGGTTIRTTLDAWARPRAASGEPLHCASTRTLERRLMQLVQLELSGVSTRPTTLASRGRVPETGDHLRIECIAPDETRLVGEGSFLGTNGELLLIGVPPQGASVAVPAGNVGSVQVRERQSRSKLVGLFGALGGGVAGGFWGKGWFEGNERGVTKNNVHYGQGVYVTMGALAGGIAGYFLGRITGSFIHTDIWVDAPDDWALRFTGLDPSRDGSAPSSCPSFSTGG
jgi:hypothetical protein